MGTGLNIIIEPTMPGAIDTEPVPVSRSKMPKVLSSPASMVIRQKISREPLVRALAPQDSSSPIISTRLRRKAGKLRSRNSRAPRRNTASAIALALSAAS